MKPIVPSMPNGRVIFCDDIRGEIGNKTSLIGVYNGSVEFPPGVKFPVGMPKIGIAIFWHEPMEGYSENITFKVTYVPLDSDPYADDGAVLVESHHDIKAMMEDEGAAPEVPLDQFVTMYRQIFSYMIISPFNVPYAGKLRVRAHRTRDVRMVGAIRIDSPDPSISG